MRSVGSARPCAVQCCPCRGRGDTNSVDQLLAPLEHALTAPRPPAYTMALLVARLKLAAPLNMGTSAMRCNTGTSELGHACAPGAAWHLHRSQCIPGRPAQRGQCSPHAQGADVANTTSCPAGTELSWESPLTLDSIVKYPSPILRRQNQRVGTFGPQLQKLADEMFDVMYKRAPYELCLCCSCSI